MSWTFILAAVAAQAVEAPQPPPAVQEPVEVKAKCRTERVTGSRMVKRVCRTTEQQRQADIEARAKLKMNSYSQPAPAFKPPTGQ